MAGRQRDRAGGRLAGGAHRRLRAAVRTRLPQTGKVSLTRSEVRFEPGDPARDGRVVVAGTQGEAASRCTVGEAIPGLLRAYRAGDASDSAAWWGAATALALDLVGRGQIVPRLSANEVEERRVARLRGAGPPGRAVGEGRLLHTEPAQPGRDGSTALGG